MSGFFAMIVGNIVNFVAYISHLAILIFRNFVFFAFIVAFFYGIYRLIRVGFDKLRGLRTPPSPPSHGTAA